ncbi:DEAD/DEAH box helicase [Marinitoga hydrogenitolerans]|nr:DEAD/DEAH box helicase [Marinitoga hydrogenitolerans]
MGRRIIYGKTWWGKKWIEAMEKIDFNTNRLPRGKRYANKGAVLEIKINRKFDIVAKVQGTRSVPYKEKISLYKFTDEEINIIANILLETPYVSGQLMSGKLPEELYDVLKNEGINLFPSSWEEINAYCSCPDWANPCKHLAAVYYIIADELDKDPFLIFEMHGLKKEKLLKLAKIQSKKTKEKNIFEPIQKDNIDISKVIEPSVFFNQKVNIIDYLPESNLSIGKNVKSLLNKIYLKNSIYIENIKLSEEINPYFKESKFEFFYDVINPKIKITGFNPISKKENITFEDFFSYFEKIPLLIKNTDNEYSVFFKKTLSFVYNLVLYNSYAPFPEQVDKEKFYIKYLPLLSNESVKNYIEFLELIIPNNLILHKNKNFVVKKKEAVIYIISLFIKEITKRAFFSNNDYLKNKILTLFISDNIYTSTNFKEKQIYTYLKNYFSPFFFKNINYSLVIKISPFIENRYSLSLLIKNNKDLLEEPIKLSTFLNKIDDSIEKEEIFKQLGFISNLSETTKLLVKNNDIIITSEELSQLLFETKSILKTFGIELLLPKEMKKIIDVKPAIVVKSKKNIISFLSLKDLLKFDWKIAIGDDFLTLEEFKKLSGKANGIIKFKDKYINLNPEKVLNILKKIEETPKIKSNFEGLKILLSGEINNVQVFLDEKVKNIISEIKNIKNIKTPKTLKATLRNYQKKGYRWLKAHTEKGFGVCLADDMGLGKTIQVISVLLKDKENKELTKPALVICPTTLIGNWANEIEKFSPSLKYNIYHGSDRELDEKSDVLITSYGVIRRDLEKIKNKEWSYIILDEAQNIKNYLSKQSKAVKLLRAERRIALTGTPIENKLIDLWSIFDFLMPGYLGNISKFVDEYAIPIEKYNNEYKMESLKSIINPFLLRRLKTDKNIIKDLPEKIIFDQYVYLTKYQTTLYNEAVKIIDSINETDGIKREGIIFKLITSLKQICNHPSNYLKDNNFDYELSGKSKKLIDLLNEILENNEKAIIFTQYKEMGKILEKIIKNNLKISPLFFHGGLNRKMREDNILKFQNSHEFPVMIISLKAGGTGLNLTSASHVIHYDLWWNPAVENQATDRAYRIGQKKNVIVHRFITKNTFEEKINELLKAKEKLSGNILKMGEKWISELSDEELKKLFKFNKQR